MKELKWKSENGDGTYTNPILYCDYSDPDVVRVGNDYYMVASSFTNAPGLPLLHSYDLVNWELINYCIKNVPDSSYDCTVRHGDGVWAPSIRYHAGKFYVCFPMPDEGIFMTTATDPYGEWSEPVNIRPGAGWIDPCPFWDEDGSAYLVSGVAKSRIGYNSVLNVTPMAPDGMSLVGETVRVFDGNELGHRTTEGPKLYKRNGYYYIFAPAGGVKGGYQLVLRSKSVYGPYEFKIVLIQGSTEVNGPHQGAWIDTVTGEDWFIHFRDVYAAGRITYLEPLTWVNDWPVIGKLLYKPDGSLEDFGEPVLTCSKPSISASLCSSSPCISNRFFGGILDLTWQFLGNFSPSFISPSFSGLFNLSSIFDHGTKNYVNLNNVLTRKWEAPQFDTVYEIDLNSLEEGDWSGIVTIGMEYSGLIFRKNNGRISLSKVYGTLHIIDGNSQCYEHENVISVDILPESKGKVKVKYSVKLSGARSDDESRSIPDDIISYAVNLSNDNVYTRVLTQYAVAGRWVGAKCGIFSAASREDSKGYLKVEKVGFYEPEDEEFKGTTIFWAGDSTVQDNFDDTYPQTGIGQAFKELASDNVRVKNCARNGRSTKSFIEEKRLEIIDREIKEDDFLFVQFGHNDEKLNTDRGTHPYGDFQDYLGKFLEVSKKHKAHLVLITPVFRRCFDSDGKLDAMNHKEYPDAMLQFGRKENVPVIDLCRLSYEHLCEIGPEKSLAYYMNFDKGLYENYPEGSKDNTHLRPDGAKTYASIIASELRKIGGIYGKIVR